MYPTVSVIIQARMGSTRFPGKVLEDLQGSPLLLHVIGRAQAIPGASQVIVATSNLVQDQPIFDLAVAAGAFAFAGSEDDVLDRYYQAALSSGGDVIVRVTAGCPLLDPEVSQTVLSRFLRGDVEYASNVNPNTYPDGLDTEVFSLAALERTWREARRASERENVTQYIWSHPELFRIGTVRAVSDFSDLRWTVDTPEDLAFMREVFAGLARRGWRGYGFHEVLSVIQEDRLQDASPLYERNEGPVRALKREGASQEEIDRLMQADREKYMGAGNRTQRMAARARARIPGGTQLLSKRPEMFAPGQWPGYYVKAKGAEVWDLDGKRYVDMSMNGIGANVLGFADPDVDAAVCAAIESGSMCTLNCPEEVELADLLCEIHPWASAVRYARCGGEAMAIAVRIARAHTQREKIAFCGYHGWHDWYLAANLADKDMLDGHLLPGLEPAGVPRGLKGTALPFRFNHPEELEAVVKGKEKEVAAIVLEPARTQEPAPGFLKRVREIASDIGAVLIFDEVSAGMRMCTGGIHLVYGVNPDIAVLAKAISNGYPMAAVIGTEDVLKAAQSTFISSTYWTERIGPTAALATIRKHRRLKVFKHLIQMGKSIREGWSSTARRTGLDVVVDGIPPLSHMIFSHPNRLPVSTLFTQLMLERGFLASTQFYATYAHTPEHVHQYLSAVEESFLLLARAVRDNAVEKCLKGPVAHGGFRRLT